MAEITEVLTFVSSTRKRPPPSPQACTKRVATRDDLCDQWCEHEHRWWATSWPGDDEEAAARGARVTHRRRAAPVRSPRAAINSRVPRPLHAALDRVAPAFCKHACRCCSGSRRSAAGRVPRVGRRARRAAFARHDKWRRITRREIAQTVLRGPRRRRRHRGGAARGDRWLRCRAPRLPRQRANGRAAAARRRHAAAGDITPRGRPPPRRTADYRRANAQTICGEPARAPCSPSGG